MVEEKTWGTGNEAQRERMLQTIISVIQTLDDQKLEYAYHFLLHIR